MSLRRQPNKRRQTAPEQDNAPPQPQASSQTEPAMTDEQAKWRALQRSIGNAAVARMQAVQKQALDEDATPVDEATQAGIQVSKQEGEPLSPQAQQAMSPSFRGLRPSNRHSQGGSEKTRADAKFCGARETAAAGPSCVTRPSHKVADRPQAQELCCF